MLWLKESFWIERNFDPEASMLGVPGVFLAAGPIYSEPVSRKNGHTAIVQYQPSDTTLHKVVSDGQTMFKIIFIIIKKTTKKLQTLTVHSIMRGKRSASVTKCDNYLQ